MSILVDPEQNEIRALQGAAAWSNRAVLEIGCGDGRLARRIVGLGASVTAIDRAGEPVRSAVVNSLQSPDQHIRYGVADGQRLPFPGETFDIVLFGWSL